MPAWSSVIILGMDTEASRPGNWIRAWSSSISAAVIAIVILPMGFANLLRGVGDPVFAAGSVAIGVGALGVLLGELGQAPLAAAPRRIYASVQVSILASIAIIGLWLALR